MVALFRLILGLFGWMDRNVKATIEWLLDLGREMATWAIEQLPEGIGEFLSDIDFTWLASVVQDVTWIIPLWTILGLYLTTYGICASVRFVRWILAFIPTIGG